MRSRVYRRLGLLVVIAGLTVGGCESTPTNYYYLEALSPPPQHVAVPSARLVVEDVTLPQYLNRADIISQKDGTQLDVPDVEQWAEDLDRGVARVLEADLAHLLADQGIVVVPADFAEGDAKLSVHVSRFEVTAAKDAVIEAQWRLVRAEDDAELLLRRASHRQEVSGEGYEAVTLALNEALHALSRDLAAAIATQPLRVEPSER